jgi:tRNA-dihydrouridine synthase
MATYGGYVHECMEVTGVEGVMSTESLLKNPTLFAGDLDSPSSIWLIRSSKLVKFDYICRSLIVFFVTVIMNKLSLQNHRLTVIMNNPKLLLLQRLSHHTII